MPDLIILLAVIILGMFTFFSILEFKEYPYAGICFCICILLSSYWTVAYFNIEHKEIIYTVKNIESDDKSIMQVINRDGRLININKKLGLIVPTGKKIRVIMKRDVWHWGIFWLLPSDEYVINKGEEL